MPEDSPRRQRTRQIVSSLQDTICNALQTLDGAATFSETAWQRDAGGGGRTRILEGGRVFEKAGVGFSCVHGHVPEALTHMPGDGETFWATGVSLVLHPRNPHVPTVHANFRHIERGDNWWLGGGADLTPYVLYDEDAHHFHATLAAPCDAFDPAFYPRFKAWCDRYFYLPHRGESRGIGGLFFDHIRPGPGVEGAASHDEEALLGWWQAMGGAFLPAYLPIARRRLDLPCDEALRTWQLQRRGRYAEFNLLYDRGTQFGLRTGGRAESILMSLPPLVRWDYDVVPEPGSPGAALVEVLEHPRDWLERG